MINIIFSVAAILITLSYLTNKLLLLRFISILGAFTYLIGGLIAGIHEPGMMALIFFSGLNLLINLVQSVRLILEHVPILLPKNLQKIYEQSFKNMTTNEFMKIYKTASTKVALKNDLLTLQDKHVEDLKMIINGRVSVKKNLKKLAILDEGFFVGEMSYLKDEAATADSEVISDKLTYLAWDKENLKNLSLSQPQLYIKFKQTIALDLIRKMDLHMNLSP